MNSFTKPQGLLQSDYSKKTYTNRIQSYFRMLYKDFLKNKYIYALAVPVLLYYFLFHYKPMYGAQIAFKNFSPGRGIEGSPWVGFLHFATFIKGPYFIRLLTNTLTINIMNLLFGFPAPIILALLLNEVRSNLFKRTVQTISYLPYFISIMVVAGMIKDFTNSQGVINDLVEILGGERKTMLLQPELFRPIYVISDIWQGVGWGSIIYIASLAGIDPALYEAATIDGAGRWKQTLHVTLPSIAPTIIILLILRMGSMMNIGYEKIILLYNEATYSTADVISSFVYRKGLLEFNWSSSTAVGLFNSATNFILLVLTNQLSRKISSTSLW